MATCSCGKRMSRYATQCEACAATRRAAQQAEYRTILQAGICPICGAKLRRNLSLTGWWQCEQVGAEGFRKNASLPPCSFQMFVD